MANFNYNKVIIGGRLTADPEYKTTPNGTSVCSFTVAVNRRPQKDDKTADFINCTAWGKTAEFVSKYFKKGDSIVVDGSIQVRSWEKDGQKRKVTEVIVNEATFVDGKNDNKQPQFEDITDQDDLPF